MKTYQFSSNIYIWLGWNCRSPVLVEQSVPRSDPVHRSLSNTRRPRMRRNWRLGRMAWGLQAQKTCWMMGILSDIHKYSDILSVTFYPKWILTFLSDHSYSIWDLTLMWHSIWHIFWHCIWHCIWDCIWHSTWHILWHFLWHNIWHPIWYFLCGILSAVFDDRLSGILSGILSDILGGILCGVVKLASSHIGCGFHALQRELACAMFFGSGTF